MSPLEQPLRQRRRLHARGVPANATTQWMLNGQPISGATASDYTASGAANPNAYSVQVSVPAEEVVQETMVAISKNLDEYQYKPQDCSFKSWIFKMAKWRIIDQIRKRPPDFIKSARMDRETDRTPTRDSACNARADGWGCATDFMTYPRVAFWVAR